MHHVPDLSGQRQVDAGDCRKKLEQCTVAVMAASIEKLEQQIDHLRAEVRRAATAGDRFRARALRTELRQAEHAWEEALADIEESAPDAPIPAPARLPEPLLPIREQVHQVLTLLGAPSAPKLIVAVSDAFFAGEVPSARLTSLRRDEERSFVAAPYARPYYICSALTADLLSAARGLLAVSTWSMTERIIGPLSPRVDFLTSAIHVAEHVDRLRAPGPAALRLLWRFAANIPGAADGFDAMKPPAVARAAQAELDIHVAADRSQRDAAARRAREQLTEVEQLFGSKLDVVDRASTGS
jgi:hypothetical protein